MDIHLFSSFLAIQSTIESMCKQFPNTRKKKKNQMNSYKQVPLPYWSFVAYVGCLYACISVVKRTDSRTKMVLKF